MKEKLKKLREERAALVTQERQQLERLEREGGSLLGAEKETYERRALDIGKLDEQVSGLEALEAAQERNRQTEERLGRPVTEPERAAAGGGEDKRALVRRECFRNFLLTGKLEQRGLEAGLAEKGGFLVAPQDFVAELIQDVDNAVFMRGLSRVFPLTNAESIGAPMLKTDAADAEWTAELTVAAQDASLEFGKRELRPHPLSKQVRVSKKLLRSAALPVDTIVRERISYKMAVPMEKAYLTGTGVQQPLGVFVASTEGVSTARDVSTGNSTTAIGADGLIEAKHTLKSQYHQGASWIFHRDAVKQIRKLKLTDNQYIWQMGLTTDLPATILELPYRASEYAPNTFTTGLYVGILGNFKRGYWIVDAMNMEIQVLNELFALTNEVGYVARLETDGAPVLEEAFARVKLA